MQNSRPLLTIAIPTYNRAGYLRTLLCNLVDQIAGDQRVKLVISDNASQDATEEVIREFDRKGVNCVIRRNDVNMGPDWNILQCYLLANSKYVWIFGDDDYVFPGGVQRIVQILERKDYDLVFLVPFGYKDDPISEFKYPRIRRPTEEISDVIRYCRLVNRHSDMVFISSTIVNKDRLDSWVGDKSRQWIGTNVVQLSWVLSALNQFRRGLFVESGIVAGKLDNSSGNFHAAKVFGENYAKAVQEWIPDNKRLRSQLISDQLLLWFSSNWLTLSAGGDGISQENAVNILTPVFGDNFRYWFLAYPLLKLPRPLAVSWAQLLRIYKFVTRLYFRV